MALLTACAAMAAPSPARVDEIRKRHEAAEVEPGTILALDSWLRSHGVDAHADRAYLLQFHTAAAVECNGLDTPERVRFYEHDFYPLSNFSAFNLRFGIHPSLVLTFPTSEHAYHFQKFVFPGAGGMTITARSEITNAPSAHEAFNAAERLKAFRNPDWDAVKVDIMRDILRAKVQQHEYVARKLLATGDRELVEDSWRDDYWGWGPNRDGQNMLGKLWMEVRAELRASPPADAAEKVRE